MQGIDPYGFVQGVAGKLDGPRDRSETAHLLDELECLMEVLDPGLQEPAHDQADRPRARPDDGS